MRLLPRRRSRRHQEPRRRATAPPSPPESSTHAVTQALEPAPPAPRKVKTPRTPEQRAARVRRLGYLFLIPVGALSAAYSYKGVYERVKSVWGAQFAYGFPILLDGLIAAASCLYIAGAMEGRPRPFWRFTAHGAVAGTIILNVLSSVHPGEVLFHIVGPIVWSAVVEGIARELLGQWKAEHHTEYHRIPRRLWITQPLRSWRATIRMHRMGYEDYRHALNDLDFISAALTIARRRKLPEADAKVIYGWLRSGALPPSSARPILQDPALDADQIVDKLGDLVIDRQQAAEQEAERRELERIAREARIAAERHRVAALEREAALRERQAQIALENAERDPGQSGESAPARVPSSRPAPAQSAPADGPGGSGPWTQGELDHLRDLYDAFLTAQEARGESPSKPITPRLLEAARDGVTLPGPDGIEVTIQARPELRLHDRPRVSANKHLDAWWKKDPRNPNRDQADTDEGRVVQLRAKG